MKFALLSTRQRALSFPRHPSPEEAMKDTLLGPDSLEWMGVRYRNILSNEATDGAMSITDSVSPPNSGPPRHIHHDADETFVMLSGDSEFWMDGETQEWSLAEQEPKEIEANFEVYRREDPDKDNDGQTGHDVQILQL